MNSPSSPVKILKAKNNTCARILTPLQVGPICWFMATFVAMFYSQRSRKLLLAASSRWNKKKELFNLLKNVLDDKYLKTAGGRESEDYRNFKDDTFLKILTLMNKEDKKAFYFNPNHKTMLNSFRPQLYIGKLYTLLGVDYKMFDYSTIDYNLRYSYLNEDYNALRISKIVDNDIIDTIDNSQGRLKDYKYIDDLSAPPIVIVRVYDYHIPVYDDILTNNVIPEDSKNSNIRYRKDNITYNGKKYTLDSAIITNTNTEHKVGHIISGITCKKERYVYNGWPRLNISPANATRELTQNIPCELMKWNWNTVYDADICLNRLKCMPDILKGKVEKGNVCFNFSGGSRILVYVRDDAKSATSSSHSPASSPVKTPVKSPAKAPAKSPAKAPTAKSPTSPIRKKQPSKKAAATARATPAAPTAAPATVTPATARAARATAREARAAAREARAAAT